MYPCTRLNDGGGDVAKKLTVPEAYREGKVSIPPGYSLEHGADALLLRRDGGSVVAVLSVRGATSSDLARTAWHDHHEQSKSTA
jgi:hypothetical protein